MKIKLQAEKVFTLTCGKAQVAGMRQVSEWEGLIKLQGPDGVAILVDETSPMVRSLDDAFNRPPADWVLLKASPAIVAKLSAEPTP
jgi:hypothetical protein